MIGSFVSFTKGDINKSISAVKSKGGDCAMICAQSPSRPSLTVKTTLPRESEHEDFQVVIHAPYTINMATTDKELRKFSFDILRLECHYAKLLGVKYVIVHCGNALKLDRGLAEKQVSAVLNMVLKYTSETTILLEGMAGKGTELGNTLESLDRILSGVVQRDRVGICLDTCHLWDAGYKLEDVVPQLEALNLLGDVKTVHVNGSLGELGCKKDRHVGMFSPDNKIPLESIYEFVRIFHNRGVVCVVEKELEYIGEEIEFLRDHTGYR